MKQHQNRPTAFGIFLCTNCFYMEEITYHNQACPECGGKDYIARNFCEEGVEDYQNAEARYIMELREDRVRLDRIIEGIANRRKKT